MAEQIKEDGPTIRLAGRDYVVAPVPVRQLRRLVPALMRVGMRAQALGADSGRLNFAALGEQDIDDIIEVVHAALVRNYPELTKDKFQDLAIPLGELIASFPVIARQAGLEQGPAAPGEAAAQTSTSTASSPGSAPTPDGPGTKSKTA